VTKKSAPPPLKVGDLVRIKAGIHDTSMPEIRMGIILERLTDKKYNDDVWNIRFLNGTELYFHEMWIEKATKEENE